MYKMGFPSMSAVRFRITSCYIPFSISGTQHVLECQVHSSTVYQRTLRYPVICMQLVAIIIHYSENSGHPNEYLLAGRFVAIFQYL